MTWSKQLRTTAGLTRLKKTTRLGSPPQRTAKIELSVKIIDELQRLRSTLLHEMCHAAAWLVDGTAKPPHGACFKKWAKLSMSRVRKNSITVLDTVTFPHNCILFFTVTCKYPLQIRNVMVTTTHDYVINYKYAWVSCDLFHIAF